MLNLIQERHFPFAGGAGALFRCLSCGIIRERAREPRAAELQAGESHASDVWLAFLSQSQHTRVAHGRRHETLHCTALHYGTPTLDYSHPHYLTIGTHAPTWGTNMAAVRRSRALSSPLLAANQLPGTPHATRSTNTLPGPRLSHSHAFRAEIC